ncbi:transposase [Virgibacillus sp. DJP39]|uniref:transposase n=1 Tax=Virgibacillus sp. DJP39 TaxID=3409790 RepID=UPI003BB5F970
MAKLKRLANLNDEVVKVIEPLSSDELLNRHLQYPLLKPLKFGKSFGNPYIPVELEYKGIPHYIHFNHCVNPFCDWFGETQKKYEHIKHKPNRYRLSSQGKHRGDAIVCNPEPEKSSKNKSHKCSVTAVSNWSVAEEIKRLATLDQVKDIKPEYQFHKEGCTIDANPFKQSKEFYRRGKSSGGSQKWQCKYCKKMTNVLPNREQKFTYNQKKNDVMPIFAKMLVNRTPVSRACEVLDISPKTYYHKLELLYKRCLEFLERYEQKPLSLLSFDSMWLNTDKMIYNLNNVRKRGHGGIRYNNTEDKLMQTHIIVTGDIDTNYIFRSDVAYDWGITLDDIYQDTIYFKEDHLHDFSKKNARLRFSYAPQPPTKNDNETSIEFNNLLSEFSRRSKYIDGMHTNSVYTVLAHLWLIERSINANKWRFVTDEDDTLMSGIYRIFADDIKSSTAHHFLCKIDRDKSLPDAYQEYINAINENKDWGELNGFTTKSLNRLAHSRLVLKLNTHQFHKVDTDGTSTYNVWAKNPINHPLPPKDKGDFTVDCKTDLSHLIMVIT